MSFLERRGCHSAAAEVEGRGGRAGGSDGGEEAVAGAGLKLK